MSLTAYHYGNGKGTFNTKNIYYFMDKIEKRIK